MKGEINKLIGVAMLMLLHAYACGGVGMMIFGGGVADTREP